MTDRKIMKLALEALETADEAGFWELQKTVVSALRERLAQPEQEPVAWVCYGAPGKRDIDFEEADINGLPIGTSLYTTPPQRKPLTDEMVVEVLGNLRESITGNVFLAFARAIEAAHGIKEKNA